MTKDIFGVPEVMEGEATGRLKFMYEDIKFILKVPIVNFMFRTLALYEQFLVLGWNQIRLNMITINMERAAQKIRYPSIDVQVPKENWNLYYDKATIERIKRVIFTFNYVNTKLLLIASAWEESLANRPIKGGGDVEGYIQPGVIHQLPNIELISIQQTTPQVRRLLLDIMNKHRSFDIASDFRALAKYPIFLEKSWEGLDTYVGSDHYLLLSKKIKEQSITLAHQMPFSVTINRPQLTPFYSNRDIAGIMGVVAMFQDFLPGLIIDGEYFRRMIL
ncbi:hypothetical protein HNQ94_001796 [Salirhabdus euzebyi]|uniref:Uncharacterized protein n=1 Tax=Salirhabdus euzebyi TaxID=394506 RepID=A0A841Q4N0_9BACI|nr:halocarboxylic acid dehydrogenase DehI family protein [Salirhabdus euzebyi]MBB6453348.1 hypothetical protein [Salirhabdus euzebyi]